MERRLLTFIIMSTAFFFFYVSMRQMFGPPAPPIAVRDGKLADAQDASPLLAGEATDSTKKADDDETSDLKPAEDDVASKRPTAVERLTLGSMDSASGQFMLITLNNQGGAVERIELTERDKKGRLRYQRVDVRNGYLGYLAAEPASAVDGMVVNVVGPGTPAATAVASGSGNQNGLRVDDILISVNGVPTVDQESLDRSLADTKPGDQVTLEVMRRKAGDDSGRQPAPLAFVATLTEHPLDLIRLSRDGGPDEVPGNLSHLSCLMTLGQVNRKGITVGERSIRGAVDPTELIWSSERKVLDNGESAEFSLELSDAEMSKIGGQAVRLKRSYTMIPGSYAIDMSMQVENLSKEPQELAYRLEGANGLTLEGWWYSTKISPNFSGAAARDVIYKTAADHHSLISGFDLLKRAKKQPEDADQAIFAPDGDADARRLSYIGVDAQYFFVGYIPSADKDTLTTFRRASAGVIATPMDIERHKERAVNVSFSLDSIVEEVPPGASIRQDLRMFAGPKDPELLAGYGLSETVYYGWFSTFAKILASLLHFLYGIVRNYGVAIVLLTVLVRAAMFPLSRKAAINAQKMQELAPELKKIADQYKDDMEGRLKAQRDLQKRVGFNPMAGCLPMFLQLPIFIGLYRALSVDIELRQAAVSSATQWSSNLAGPDMFTYWGDWLWDYLSGRGTGWLGPYFNILPVLVVALFLIQQKLFMPPATDEQTRMTQKMMNIMTLMMGLFFFRVPAGLCIYFITSSLWGICERVLVKKTLPSEKHFDSNVLEGVVNSEGSVAVKKPLSIAERIRQQISPEEEPIAKPNKRKRPGSKKKGS